MKIFIELIIKFKGWHLYLEELEMDKLEAIAEKAIKEYSSLKEDKMQNSKHQNLKLQIAVVFSNDKHIKELNRNFRNEDKSTNVLSFPEWHIEKPGHIDLEEILEDSLSNFEMEDDYIPLGDVVFSYQTMVKETEELGIPFANHFYHLFVHSVLHLLGYDHAEDEEEKHMQSIETQILEKFNIPSPY